MISSQPLFDAKALEEAIQLAGKPYSTSERGPYESLRSSLEELFGYIQEQLPDFTPVICRREKFNRQAGRGAKHNNWADYVLLGICPASMDRGRSLFVKLIVHSLASGDPKLAVELDYEYSSPDHRPPGTVRQRVDEVKTELVFSISFKELKEAEIGEIWSHLEKAVVRNLQAYVSAHEFWSAQETWEKPKRNEIKYWWLNSADEGFMNVKYSPNNIPSTTVGVPPSYWNGEDQVETGDFVLVYSIEKGLLIASYQVFSARAFSSTLGDRLILDAFKYQLNHKPISGSQVDHYMTYRNSEVSLNPNDIQEISKEKYLELNLLLQLGQSSLDKALQKGTDLNEVISRAKDEGAILETPDEENLIRLLRSLKEEDIEALGNLPDFHPEGDHTHKDQLEFQPDVDALANLLAYQKTPAPLAIGLFGHWGSGKSFFMEKLEDKITELSKSEYKDIYCQKIVHVRFNSWHYSDDNLWASLVTRIFSALEVEVAKQAGQEDDPKKLLYQKLKSSQKAKEWAEASRKGIEKEKLAIQGRIEKLQEKRKELEKKKGFPSFNAIRDGVLDSGILDGEFQSLKQALGKDLNKNLDEIEGALLRLKEQGYIIASISRTFNKSNWPQRILFIVLLGLIIFLSSNISDWFNWEGIRAIFGTGLTAILGGLASLSAIISPAMRHLRRAKGTMDHIIQRSNAEALLESDRLQSKQRSLDAEILRLNGLETALELQIQDHNLEIEKVNQQIEDIESGKRLADFIREKSQDARYHQKLGIISWIRKDFEQLEKELMLSQDESVKEKKFQVDRIILYIDDLDRCSQERVVEVLEAVHLILAFKLFAVVVGVDPRWVSNALEHRFLHLLNAPDSEEDNEQASTDSATSYDYLEKIFQVPFKLKGMEHKDTGKLIDFLTREEGENVLTASETKSELASTSSTEGTDSGYETKSKVDVDEDNQTASDEEQEPMTLGGTKEPYAGTNIDSSQPKALALSEEDKAFMKSMAQIVGSTPRTVKRYVNVYRVVCSHSTMRDSDPNKRRRIMFLLGLVIGHPTLAEEFLRAISKSEESIADCLNQYSPKLALPSEPEIQGIGKVSAKEFHDLIPLISRFTFRSIEV